MSVNRTHKRRAALLHRTPRVLITKFLSDVAIHSLGYLILRHSADDLLDHLAVLENENRRDAADVIPPRRVHRFVHVQLHHFNLARVVVRDLRHRRRQHVTRAAPFRPKIYEYRLRLARRKYFIFKISISCCLDVFRHVLHHQRLGQPARRLSPFARLIRCCNRHLVTRRLPQSSCRPRRFVNLQIFRRRRLP